MFLLSLSKFNSLMIRKYAMHDLNFVQSDFHFDRGISARVKDLSAHDINDFKILFHNCLL